jgi:hypothetical protein
LRLNDLAPILEALGRSELGAVFEALDAYDATTIDALSHWLRARSREWLLRWEARRADAALAATADHFAQMLLRREAVAARAEHGAAERTLALAEQRLTTHLGAGRAAILRRAVARTQDLARAAWVLAD